MRPAFATRATPTGFWVVLPRSSRAVRSRALVHNVVRPLSRTAASVVRSCVRVHTANPAMGLGVFSRACRMPFRRHVVGSARRRARTRPQFAAAVPFALAAIRSWVFRRLMQWTCARELTQSFCNEFRATEATSLPSPALQRIRAICA